MAKFEVPIVKEWDFITVWSCKTTRFVRKSCWKAKPCLPATCSIQIQQMFQKFKLWCKLILECQRPQTWPFGCFQCTLSISGMFQVIAHSCKGPNYWQSFMKGSLDSTIPEENLDIQMEHFFPVVLTQAIHYGSRLHKRQHINWDTYTSHVFLQYDALSRKFKTTALITSDQY